VGFPEEESRYKDLRGDLVYVDLEWGHPNAEVLHFCFFTIQKGSAPLKERKRTDTERGPKGQGIDGPGTTIRGESDLRGD